MGKAVFARAAVLAVVAAALMLPGAGRGASEVVDEVHYTFTGPTSVAFDWRGAATDIRY